MRKIALLSLSLSILPGVCGAQDATCKPQQDNLSAITKKYQAIYAADEQDGDNLKQQSATFNFDVTWGDTPIDIETPSVTMENQTLTFGVPQVTMKTQDIIFGTPTITMVQVKTGQYPQTTCSPFPNCTVTWSNIYTSVPQTTIQQQDIKTDIPQFTWADTQIVIGVPQFFMQKQHWVVGLPQFKLVSAAINASSLKQSSDDLKNDIDSTQAAQRQDYTDAITSLFGCYRTGVTNNRFTANQQFNSALSQIDSVIQSLPSGVDPTKIADSNGTTTNLIAERADIVAKRDAALATFDAALAKLDQSEKDAIKNLGG